MNLTVLAHIESTTLAQQLKRKISKGVELHINITSRYCISDLCVIICMIHIWEKYFGLDQIHRKDFF